MMLLTNYRKSIDDARRNCYYNMLCIFYLVNKNLYFSKITAIIFYNITRANKSLYHQTSINWQPRS